jgi:hypothetical protein
MPAHCKELIQAYLRIARNLLYTVLPTRLLNVLISKINTGTLAHCKELIQICLRIAKNEYQHAFAL